MAPKAEKGGKGKETKDKPAGGAAPAPAKDAAAPKEVKKDDKKGKK